MSPPSSSDPAAASTSRTTPASDAQPPHTLRRNQACLSCRKRKLKCDAQRPMCGTCVRSREAAAINKYVCPVPLGDCVYPDLEPALLPEGPEHTLPPAYRTSSAAARSQRAPSGADAAPAHTQTRAPKRQRRDTQVEAETDELRAMVVRLEKLLAESQKTIKAQREYAELHGLVLLPPTLSGADDDILALDVVSVNGHSEKPGTRSSTRTSDPVPGKRSREWTTLSGLTASQPQLIGWTGDSLDRAACVSSSPHSTTTRRALSSTPGLSTVPTGSVAGLLDPACGIDVADPSGLIDLTAFCSMTNSWPFGGPSPQPTLAPQPSIMPPPIMGAPLSEPFAQSFAPQSPYKEASVDLLAELLWPGWPTDLPPPETVYALVDEFFALHPMRPMFQESDFKRRLRLQPSSNRWPDKGLLHSIIAATAPLSGLFGPGREPPMLCVSSRIPSIHPNSDQGPKWQALGPLHPRSLPLASEETTSLSFAEFHMVKAQVHVSCALSTMTTLQGRNPPELLQSLMIVGDILYQRARVIDCYLLTGLFCKALGPCGLLKLRPYKHDNPPIPGCMMPPCSSIEEEELRRRTFWYAYMADAWYSNPGFFHSTSLVDEAITTSFPSASRDKCQTLSTPDNELFGSGHTDDFTLHVKAVVLFKRVRVLLSEVEPRSRMTLVFAQRIGALDQAIHLFLSVCPRPTDMKRVDLLCARLAAVGALAALHDQFVNFAEPLSYPFQQVQRAVDEAVLAVDLIRASDVEPGHLPSRALFTFMTSAKLLAEHLSHLRLAGTSTTAQAERWDHLRGMFDKLLLLLRDMSSTGGFCAAEEAFMRLSELQRCKFDEAAVQRHHFAVQMPPVGTSRFQAVP